MSPPQRPSLSFSAPVWLPLLCPAAAASAPARCGLSAGRPARGMGLPRAPAARPHLPARACASGARVLHEATVPVGDASVALRVEDVGGRRRRVSGGIDIDCGVARVWEVLTQYGVMDRYMPNITRSDVFREGGEVFLDQVGVISRKLGLKSRMVMKVRERELEEIVFSRVEGRDFSEFEGKYLFREGADGGCRLDYELVAVPMPLFPVAMVERKIVKEVPAMLASVRTEAMEGRVVAFS